MQMKTEVQCTDACMGLSILLMTTQKAEIPVRFAAGKIAEGDKRIIEKLKLTKTKKKKCWSIILQMETERKLDRSAAIADMRYDFIKSHPARLS